MPAGDGPVLWAWEALRLLTAAAESQASGGRVTPSHPPTPDQGGDRELQTGLLRQLHRANGQLWLHEDEIRAAGRTDSDIAALRRAIERLNLERNDRIDRLNQAYALALRPHPAAPLATEAPGTALDRLSVLVLRLAYTRVRAHTDESLLDRLPLLQAQLFDLRQSIDLLIDDVRSGRRRFASYQAAKLYGSRPGRSA
ncbi:MAG TPA: DUF4254 domain-containing protein [Pseudonocardiaceae bacterium]|jgi:hypothetical protein|nr:DUF4254 domain-containing protein [Pseudonocardiaceae bacterium]